MSYSIEYMTYETELDGFRSFYYVRIVKKLKRVDAGSVVVIRRSGVKQHMLLRKSDAWDIRGS